MNEKDTRFNVRVNEQWVERLQLVAKVLDQPASQIVRDAVNERIDRLCAENKTVAKAIRALAA